MAVMVVVSLRAVVTVIYGSQMQLKCLGMSWTGTGDSWTPLFIGAGQNNFLSEFIMVEEVRMYSTSNGPLRRAMMSSLEFSLPGPKCDANLSALWNQWVLTHNQISPHLNKFQPDCFNLLV